MRGVLSALLLLACSGESTSVDAVHCAGVLADSRIGYEYGLESTGETRGRVFTDEADAEGVGRDGRVSVALDWRGEANGGSFEFFRDGSVLFVDYSDPDGNRYWSVTECFPQ